jgi:hypothetical protein
VGNVTVRVETKCTILPDCQELVVLFPDLFDSKLVRISHGTEHNMMVIDADEVQVRRMEHDGQVWHDFNLPGYLLKWLDDLHKEDGWHPDIIEGRS